MKKRKFFKTAAIALAITAMGASSAGASGFHFIEKGDTLWGLSQKYGMTVKQLKETNQLTSDTIYAGNKLEVKKLVTVKKGDTLWSIAKNYDSTVAQLKHVNGLKSDTIRIGQKLIIPNVVLVRSGDTLWSISRKYGLTVEELKKRNGLKNNVILVGQVLKVNKISGNSLSYDAEKVKLRLTPDLGYRFVSEEPRKFILEYGRDTDYFTRVEVLDAKSDLKSVKKNAEQQLKTLGKVTEIPTKNSVSFYRDAHFFLHADNSTFQTNIAVKEVNGKLLKFTIHFPNAEESEAVIPEMLKMLSSIHVK